VSSIFQTIGMMTACLVAGTCFGQSNPAHRTLCGLQGKVAEGDHVSVTISGVYEGGLGDSGPAMGTLGDSACPMETAWIEVALQSPNNRKKLNRILRKSGRAYVVFEGELYGSPMPDPKLPEAIRKNYHPGWGHLGAFKTKLVVRAIREVGVAPPTKQ
jgi:hypothetical protein